MIRTLCPADAVAYRTVRLAALQASPPAFGSLPENEPDLSSISARLQPDDHRCFFGAFDGERLIGIVRVSRSAARNENHRADLGGLYVLPSHRRIGCGKALVRAALNHAANTPGVRRVNLTVVTQQHAAIRLYGTERETFSRDGQFYDEHLMTLELIPDVTDTV